MDGGSDPPAGGINPSSVARLFHGGAPKFGKHPLQKTQVNPPVEAKNHTLVGRRFYDKIMVHAAKFSARKLS